MFFKVLETYSHSWVYINKNEALLCFHGEPGSMKTHLELVIDPLLFWNQLKFVNELCLEFQSRDELLGCL